MTADDIIELDYFVMDLINYGELFNDLCNKMVVMTTNIFNEKVIIKSRIPKLSVAPINFIDVFSHHLMFDFGTSAMI